MLSAIGSGSVGNLVADLSSSYRRLLMKNRSRYLIAAGLFSFAVAPALAGEAKFALTPRAESNLDADEADGATAQAEDPVPAPPPQSDWEFSAGAYLWMAGLKGDVGVSTEVQPIALDFSFGHILDALKFATMGTFEARKGRFMGSADLLYLSLGGSKNFAIRDADLIDGELDIKTLISTLTAGYRVVDQREFSLDALGGVRINSMKMELDLTGPNRSFSGTRSETWFDPLVGTRLRFPFDQRWSVEGYGDVGGFGMGSDISWQLQGLVRYAWNKQLALTAGWRHLKINYDKKDGFLFDAAMDGPILAATYRF